MNSLIYVLHIISASWSSLSPTISTCESLFERMQLLLNELMGRQIGDVSTDQLGDMIDKEMRDMDEAIKQAADKIKVAFYYSLRFVFTDCLNANNDISVA